MVECGGVGFKCLTTLGTQRNLPQLGEIVTLYTHLNVRRMRWIYSVFTA